MVKASTRVPPALQRRRRGYGVRQAMTIRDVRTIA